MQKIFFFFVLLFLSVICSVETQAMPEERGKEALASRVAKPPVVDGKLEPEVWSYGIPVTGFMQFDPDYQEYPSYRSEVRILYDDRAIYVGAIFYDSHPDSILKQMGPRDSSLNSDAFGIRFDTYNNQLDNYTFEVSAAGVQRDFRAQDHTYDGVWSSAVSIYKKGWSVEMRIPFSAMRFPAVDCQKWGFQMYRNIRRYREVNHWALEERSSSNRMVYWGILTGICDVKSPLRLSFTPYLSTTGSHYPQGNPGISNYSSSFGGGMDLKYGINEAYTLDMTLMPDFSQVPSDNVVKNLSAFETVYGEQRPFFKESMDLFRRGGLFYSRRIGSTPSAYYQVEDELNYGEEIIDNPAQSKLVNAFKVSGRSGNGLALGIFNAVINNTYATILDAEGNKRRFLTQPFTNYNILVADKAIRSNSSAYLINASVLRGGDARHANVTGAGLSLSDKGNSYQFEASGALSQLYEKPDSINHNYDVDTGLKYDLSFQKIRGNFRFNLRRSALDPFFNNNDIGITQRRDQVVDRIDLNYHIYNSFWKLRNLRSRITLRNEARYDYTPITNQFLESQVNTSTLDYLSMWAGFNFSLRDRIDFYEPRQEGMFFIKPQAFSTWMGLSSDYRKPFAFDLRFSYGEIDDFNYQGFSYNLSPRYRVNDYFSFSHQLELSKKYNDIGYAGHNNSDVVFGNRQVTTIENVFSSDYILSNTMYLSFRMRQYWSAGEYSEFYKLRENGRLEDDYQYDQNRNFNFNSFNIDFVYTWLFAPGSSMNIIWKNSVLHEQSGLVDDYFDNFGLLNDAPKYNSLSVKILYYLDYQQIRGV